MLAIFAWGIGPIHKEEALWISFTLIILLMLTVMVVFYVSKNKQVKALQKINDIAEEANRLKTAFIANMTQANTFDYNDEEVDINALIDEVCAAENRRSHPSGIKVEYQERLSQCRLKTDRKRFAQVMENLLENALKFTEKGSVTVGSRRLSNGNYYFYVADTGCGIDDEGRHAIFERFVKMNYNIKGTGLGLSITKSIIEHYGGGIGVESKKGEGSTFYFTLPGSMEYKEYGKF